MEKKTISINPDLFSTGGKRKSNKKKTKRIKPRPVIKPNVMQKALLERIKEHQSKNEKSTKKIASDQISGSEFEKHLDYLSQLRKQRKERKKTNKNRKGKYVNSSTIKIPTSVSSINEAPSIVSVSIPPAPPPSPISSVPPMLPSVESIPLLESQTVVESVPPPIIPTPLVRPQDITSSSINEILSKEKPYSNLKNSKNKPSYRTWKKNTQKNFCFSDTPINSVDNMDISEMTTNDTPLTIKKYNMDKKKAYKKKTYTKRKYKLGRNENSDIVSVFIKSNNNRKIIQEEIDKLKMTPLKDVKDYLRKHCLIKVGSNAPNDVLRKMYETSILSGDVNNKTKGTLLHNYLNE
tara:strand:+ start:441 stop:1490 length:1050 start_codon:yes stop_codon:yes gene_type:complete